MMDDDAAGSGWQGEVPDPTPPGGTYSPAEADQAAEIQEFWEVARFRTGLMRTAVVTGMSDVATVPPPSWSFGDTPTLADQLLALVLEGTKTATASSVAELEQAGEPMPRAGDLSIACDGAGRPRALLRTTTVEIVPFGEVDAEFARLEGEGDRSLEAWRRERERYFRRVLAGSGTKFSTDLPLVLERFELLYPPPSDI